MNGALFCPKRLPGRHARDPGAGGTLTTAAEYVLAVPCRRLCRYTSCLARQRWDAWERHDPPWRQGDQDLLPLQRYGLTHCDLQRRASNGPERVEVGWFFKT